MFLGKNNTNQLAKIVSFLGVKKFEEFLKDYDIKFDIS